MSYDKNSTGNSTDAIPLLSRESRAGAGENRTTLSKPTTSRNNVAVQLRKYSVAQYAIEGMSCSSCVNAIVSCLEADPGIEKATVNLLSKTAVVQFDSQVWTDRTVAGLITDLGFPARLMEASKPGSLLLDVTWQGKLNEKAFINGLSKLPGVRSVEFRQKLLAIEYQVEIIKGRDIVKWIDSQSYPIKVSPQTIESLTRDSLSHQTEIRKWRLLFFLCVLFAVPTMGIMIPHMFIPVAMEWLEHNVYSKLNGITPYAIITFALATPVQFGFGWFLYVNSYKSLKRCTPSMDVLIALGTSVAYFYSIVAIVLLMTNYLQKSSLEFETSVMLITFITLGRFIENMAKGRTSSAITKLMDLKTPTAMVVTTNEQGEVVSSTVIDSNLLEPGDLCKVLPSAGIPGDGVVVKGNSTVNESMLTGETAPVVKKVGSKVVAGTINVTKSFIMRVESVGADTVLTQITKLVQDAQNSKPEIQKLGDKISGVFVPCVICIAIIDFIVWASLIMTDSIPADWIDERYGHDLVFASNFPIAVLVISCPCAIGLATPTAMMVGTGVGARHGIFITTGEVVERAKKIDTVVFDKTGTLTLGKPVVCDWEIFTDITEDKFFATVASAELDSEHPIGKAIVQHAMDMECDLGQPTEFEGIEGKGIQCIVKGAKILIGTRRLMNENGIPMSDHVTSTLSTFQERGCTTMLCCVDSVITGVVALRDPHRKEAKAVISYLHKHNIETYMLTGDNQATAEAIGHDVGIAHVFAKVLPHEKQNKIQELQASGKVVAMVGDGINDTPALAQADMGIAIGAGTDAAKATAEIVLMRSNLTDVLVALQVCKNTYNQIKLNFLWAFLYNTLAIPFAAGLFFPLIKEPMPPWLAGLLMAVSSVSVVLFSLRLRFFNPKRFYDLQVNKTDQEIMPMQQLFSQERPVSLDDDDDY